MSNNPAKYEQYLRSILDISVTLSPLSTVFLFLGPNFTSYVKEI